MDEFLEELPPVEIQGNRVLLRSLGAKDAGPLYALIDGSRRFLAAHLPWPMECGSAQDVEHRIETWDLQSEMGNGACWGIFDVGHAAGTVLTPGVASFACESQVPGTPVLAGCIIVGWVQWAHRSASLSYWLGESFTGHGLATESLRLVSRHLFTLGFNRLELSVSVTNPKSAAVARRAGFVEEGISREFERINGTFEDHLRFARLSRDL